jgi:hypothetical protein
MRLGAELVVAELEKGHDLAGQLLGCAVPLRVEHDLGDELAVGFDHGHLTEQLFEVLG